VLLGSGQGCEIPVAGEKLGRGVRRHGGEVVVGGPRGIDDLPEIVNGKVVLMLMLMLMVMLMVVVVMVIFHFHEWDLREKEGVMNWK